MTTSPPRPRRSSSPPTQASPARRGPRRLPPIHRAARALGSALAAAALLVGVPWLLLVAVGNPVGRWRDLLAGDLSNQVILAMLAVVGWLLWAQFATAFVIELVSAARHTPMPARIPGVLAAQQRLARVLVNGALMLLPVGVSAVAPAGQALAMTAALPSLPAAAPVTQAAAQPAAEADRVVLTVDGPRTWWDLAATHVGDGAAWRQVWALNAGRVQPDGTTLTSERTVLRPGWTILLPITTPGVNPARTVSPQTTSGERADPDAAAVDVTVRPGDTLSAIAAENTAGDWTRLWAANADREQPHGARFTDPDHLEPGWVVTLPAPDPGSSDPAGGDTDAGIVAVAPGDTLSQIAADHDTDVEALLAANTGRPQAGGATLTDPDRIETGWRLQLPDPTLPALDEAPSGGAADHADTPPPAAQPPAGAADIPGSPADIPPPPAADNPAQLADPPPVTPAPVTVPDAEMSAAADPADPSEADEPAGSAAGVAAFAGAGGVLAAVMLAALTRYRRRQARHRRPGHDPVAIPEDLAAMERALLTVGSASGGRASWLDEALHGLAHLSEEDGGALPDVAAACLTASTLQLVLHTPRTDPPGAWTSNADGTRWTLSRAEPTGYRAERRGYLAAPFPTLATIGHTPAGEHWLIDLERIGAVTVTGDRDRAVALARSLAAELAHNTWAESVQVTLAGFGHEMTGMHPDRLTYAGDPAAAVTELRRQRAMVTRFAEQAGVGVLDGRRTGAAGDAWTPQVLLIALGQDADADLVDPVGGAAEEAAGLAETLAGDRDRAGVALVVAGGDGPAPAGGWELRITDDGVLHVPALAVSLIAQQIPRAEAAQLAQLLAFVADPTPAPADTSDTDDHSGPHAADPDGEADSVSVVREVVGRPPRLGSVLDGPDEAYLAAGATTGADLQVLAPAVPPLVRAQIEAGDDDLDADLAAWHDPADPRPKVTVLGGPAVRAGTSRFSAFNIEITVYLAAARRGGVGIDRYATDMWPNEPDIVGQTTVKSKVRTSISQVRKLLGVNPATGGEYLPRNGGASGGEYRLDPDVLVDADLFRRLRIRGLARGRDGLDDLHAALDLVRGVPFGTRRPGGYGWLADVPLDHELTAMVVDLAHVVATHYLAAGEPELAAAAAQTALRAGSSEDTPLLDLVAACHAQGQAAQAEALVRQIMVNHDADVEEDLPPRTFEVLRRRRWLPPAA